MHFFVKALLLAALSIMPLIADEAAPARPWETGAIDLESGMLWQIGTGTPLSYRLIPNQLSWRSREVLGRGFVGGSRLVVRHRLTLLSTWVQQGPESHYVGFSGSPSVEWWNKDGTWSWFGGAGGGCGLIDARDMRGGQGQDFTLNWFIRGGFDHVTAKGLRLNAGIMYQHMSNGGQTEPNPGIDALGFTLGGGWTF